MSKCRLCGNRTEIFDSARILNQAAIYSRCIDCESVQVENPHWLSKAHEQAISNFDTGIVARNLIVSKLVTATLRLNSYTNEQVLDWGGGTGLLTRLLRDKGINCFSFDPFCESSICPEFQLKSFEKSEPFLALIAVETVEHLEDPEKEFREISRNANFMFLTTEILPIPNPLPRMLDWWYFMPQSGQHVTFASESGIRNLLIRLGFPFYLRIGSLFIGSKKRFSLGSRIILTSRVLRKIYLTFPMEFESKRKSLTFYDQSELMKKSGF